MPDQPMTTKRQKPITLGKLLLVFVIFITTVIMEPIWFWIFG